jgi:hypothetical protein
VAIDAVMTPVVGNLPEPWASMGLNQRFVVFGDAHVMTVYGEYRKVSPQVKLHFGGVPFPAGTRVFIMAVNAEFDLAFLWLNLAPGFADPVVIDFAVDTTFYNFHCVLWNESLKLVSGTFEIMLTHEYF